jgi:hypothetical protein
VSQQTSSPPEQSQEPVSQPLSDHEHQLSRSGIISLLVLVGLLLLLFTGLLIHSLPQAIHQSSTSSPTSQSENTDPLQFPGDAAATPVQTPAGSYVVYEQQNNIYLVPTGGGTPQVITTPGYIYNRAVPPILLPSGKLLYSGDGLWLTDVFSGSPQQIATLPPDQVITSMVLSSDGSTIAWSSEPADGSGMITIYAGPLTASTIVYQHAATDCPCFRVFSFMQGTGQQGNSTLLLTDDRGDHRAVQYGLWRFSLNANPPSDPQKLLGEEPLQAPLALAPSGNTLLYSSLEGVVPVPSDGSVPGDVATLSYANSLFMTALDDKPVFQNPSHVILPEQRDLNNSGAYHWVTTPIFSPDGHTLAYVEFSSDAQSPFDRHSALYIVHISGSGSRLHVGRPQLLATSTARLVELGAWLNNQMLTFYADDSVYALDVQSGSVSTIVHTGEYARITAIVK